MVRGSAVMSLMLALAPVIAMGQEAAGAPDISTQVEVRRTTYGVPHIKAQNLRAAGYALGFVQMEDYGVRVARGLLAGRGQYGRAFGRDSMESDFLTRHSYARAVQSYHLLDADTREVYEGFAAGVNRYMEMHPEEFPAGLHPDFTGYDVAARDVGGADPSQARQFLDRIDTTRRQSRQPQTPGEGVNPDDGSNAWAFAPSRTKSGRAILLRNPHLNWNAGYYEAHMTVPGVLDFYGDFRIGGPFGVIGGFNRDLGFATTNNDPDLDEIYALDVAPGQTDRYMLDGTSLPLTRELVTVEYRNGDGYSTETREMWYTPLGPVIHRANGKIYVLRAAGDGEFRGGEQFLRMMRAKNLAEFKDAMRMRARINSSFTYADRAGNIYYLWNASIPSLPHASGGDTLAIPVRRTSDVWTRYVPFDSLPQVLNPKGGYVHNENDSFHYTNMRQILDSARFPTNFSRPRLGLRSQHAIELIDNNRKFSLEDVWKLKHSYRMLAADRLKADLIAAVRASSPAGDVLEGVSVLEKWDNTVAPESRGGVLFEAWVRRYVTVMRGSDSLVYKRRWTPADPLRTPHGIGDVAKARDAFTQAVADVKKQFGALDVKWGEVHRVRRGSVDVPVGGCSGQLGCFRVLSFRTDSTTGKRTAVSGDGWIIAVEFGETVPRAYSVLAYGQSPRPDSPHHADQAEMFAKGEGKRIAFTDRDIDAQTIRRYRPGAR